mmetsp:Transcript_23128/g.26179  ORF Transcript_23128/g.26179 Transcript_23128/m.26179 type:complete len:139 (-) Transcript_23128:73-489(-)
MIELFSLPSILSEASPFEREERSKEEANQKLIILLLSTRFFPPSLSVSLSLSLCLYFIFFVCMTRPFENLCYQPKAKQTQLFYCLSLLVVLVDTVVSSTLHYIFLLFLVLYSNLPFEYSSMLFSWYSISMFLKSSGFR